jgi:hypothetical protein
MSSGSGQTPSEEELRAAYEAEIKRLRVEHVLLDNVAALVNLGMRRTGLVPGTESERDPAQVRLAIEAVRGLLPVLEQSAPGQIGAIRDAVSQLQMAFVKMGGDAGAATGAGAPGAGGSAGGEGGPGEGGSGPGGPSGGPPPPEPPPPKPGEPGPAQRSGRLWVPGQ